MKSSVKMIVTGLDNTLLRSDGSLSNYTLAIFEKCRRKGILTAVATSRFSIACALVCEFLSPDILISDCGALARRRRRILCRYPIAPEIASRLIWTLQESGLSDIAAGLENGCLWSSRDIYSSPVMRGAVYDDFKEPLLDDIFKISVDCAGQPHVVHEAALRFPRISLVSHSGGYYSFISSKASKEAAVISSAAACGIRPDNILAFGGGIADIGMLKACGRGVAVGGTAIAAMESVNFVCAARDEDGAANYIAKHVLNL